MDRIELQLRIAASPQDVFRALTSSDELEQWFAERAEVSPEEGRYDFWGRLTPEAPGRQAGRHELLEVEAPRRLKFAWNLRDEETTVLISLDADGQKTVLRVSHSGLPPRSEGEYALADFWALTLENLRGWVERKTVGVRCDFSEQKRGDVRLEVDIEAPPEKIYRALIDPQQLNRYIATNAFVDMQVGGRYDFGWDHGPVKIVELTPNETLAYEWAYRDELDTIVTWRLEGSGGRTRLTLIHSGFAEERRSDDYGVGWLHFLNRIKFMVEGGEAWEKTSVSSFEY